MNALERDATHREERQERGSDVVGLALERPEENLFEHERDRHRAQLARRQPQPREHHRQRERVHFEKLFGEIARQRPRRVLPLLRGEQLEHGKAVAHLPDRVRKDDQRGDRGRQQDSPRAQLRIGENAGEQADGVEGERVLVEDADPGQRADREPAALEREQHHRQIEDRFEGVHGQEAALADIDRRQRDANARQRHRERSALLPLHEDARQKDGRGVGDRGRQPVEPDVLAGQSVREPGDERDQGRLIDVAPGQPAAAGEKIHLVAKPAVISTTYKVQPERPERQQPGDAGDVRPLL